MTGCSGMYVCTKPRPSVERAAGAARDLVQELEGALARARVGAVREAQVAVDDADSGEQREMVPLGDDLRADDDVDLAGLDRSG